MAANSFHRSVKLDPQNVQAAINEIQSLQVLNHQHLDSGLRKKLHLILDQHPNQLDALAILAADAQQNHDYSNEIKYLESLLSYLPATSSEASMIRKELAAAYASEGAE